MLGKEVGYLKEADFTKEYKLTLKLKEMSELVGLVPVQAHPSVWRVQTENSASANSRIAHWFETVTPEQDPAENLLQDTKKELTEGKADAQNGIP